MTSPSLPEWQKEKNLHVWHHLATCGALVGVLRQMTGGFVLEVIHRTNFHTISELSLMVFIAWRETLADDNGMRRITSCRHTIGMFLRKYFLCWAVLFVFSRIVKRKREREREREWEEFLRRREGWSAWDGSRISGWMETKEMYMWWECVWNRPMGHEQEAMSCSFSCLPTVQASTVWDGSYDPYAGAGKHNLSDVLIASCIL
jgi:hypothetical protein